MMTPLPLTELNKLIEGLPGREFYLASRTALPNALRVIAECKRVLDTLNDPCGSEMPKEALALIAAFERDVLQQEKM